MRAFNRDELYVTASPMSSENLAPIWTCANSEWNPPLRASTVIEAAGACNDVSASLALTLVAFGVCPDGCVPCIRVVGGGWAEQPA